MEPFTCVRALEAGLPAASLRHSFVLGMLLRFFSFSLGVGVLARGGGGKTGGETLSPPHGGGWED